MRTPRHLPKRNNAVRELREKLKYSKNKDGCAVYAKYRLGFIISHKRTEHFETIQD